MRNSMLKARHPIETSTDSYMPSIPKVVNVKMVGDLRVTKKLVITGDVIKGDERLRIAQFFITLSKEDNFESDIEAITLPKSGKKGSYWNHLQGDPTFQEPRKLSSKLTYKVKFYNNGPVREYRKYWSRHLGIIMPDNTMCLIRVQLLQNVSEVDKNSHNEIVNTIEYEPTLTNFQVVEKCFGPQTHNNGFSYGGGMKRKHFKEPRSTYVKELEPRLREKRMKKIASFEDGLIIWIRYPYNHLMVLLKSAKNDIHGVILAPGFVKRQDNE
ncbi:hypothetical protein Scep_019550 [Stephania cephalantha]|uniref:Uncharacterized protein n=1 Tax=Stephania cephalantha TaxID=152367 RepID=A0AAP0NPX5_9MAGN